MSVVAAACCAEIAKAGSISGPAATTLMCGKAGSKEEQKRRVEQKKREN